MEASQLFGHLIAEDLVVAGTAFLARKAYDMYTSHEKVVKKNEKFTLKEFYKRNGMRYFASFFIAVVLILSLPEGISYLYNEFAGKELAWNTLLSAIVGFTPVEIMLYIKKRIKRKADEKINNHIN